MKSHFLLSVASEALAKEALRVQLPGQEQPWLLLSSSGDPVAYFNIGTTLDGKATTHVQADISGRHYDRSEDVVNVLRQLQASVGGILSDDA